MADIREGSSPNFAPPVEEGVVFQFEDEKGDIESLEFLGLVLHNDHRYGFFFPVEEDLPAGSSGEVLILEVTELDEEASPQASSFWLTRAWPGSLRCVRRGDQRHLSFRVSDPYAAKAVLRGRFCLWFSRGCI